MTIQRVLITGAAGAGGRCLVEYLRANHPEVEIHGLVRQKMRKEVPGVILHEADLLDTGSLVKAIRHSRPDVVFHLAANPDKGFEIPSGILLNNAVGTANLFEALRLERNDWQELDSVIVNVSSSEVYGQVSPDEVPIKETQPFRPVSPYGISKVAQDLLGRMYYQAYGMRVVATRAFSYTNLYRRDIFTSNFARQIALIEKGELKVLKHGNLDSVRCFVSTQDIMHAYWLAATKCEYGEAYNLGGNTIMSVGEVLERMIRMSNVYIPCEQDPSLMRPVDVTLQIPCVDKFINATGWTQHFDTDKVLKEQLDYWRKEIRL